jgi:DNA transformation protein
MAFSADYLDFVLDQMDSFGPITYKKMFGGVGFYKDGLMFGGLMNGILHFKVDDLTRQTFIDRGMEPFAHGKPKKNLPTYYQVPVEIIEDRDELAIWAEKAYAAALSSKK